LISFFIEILVQRHELTIDDSYQLAKIFYGKWKVFVKNELKESLSTGGVRKDLLPLIEAKLNGTK